MYKADEGAPPAEVTATQRPHFEALDSLRGIAAVCVTLFHVTWENPIRELPAVRNSYLMVDVFFVLSGFVIFYAYREKLKAAGDFRRFIWLRFWRLYPLHLLFLLVAAGMEFSRLAGRHYGIQLRHGTFENNNVFTFVLNLFLIQSLHTTTALTFNTPAWSVSVEFCAYFIFALLLLALSNSKMFLISAIALCLGSVAMLALLGPQAGSATYDYGILRCIFGFFAGVLSYQAFNRAQKTRWIQAHQSSAGFFALALIGGFVIFLLVKNPGYSDLLTTPISAGIIFFVALSSGRGPMAFLHTRALLWLGAISYSIYMAHLAVEFCVRNMLRSMVHVPVHVSILGTQVITTPLLGSLALIVYETAVILVASCTYKWIEMPCRNWSRQWLKTPKRPIIR